MEKNQKIDILEKLFMFSIIVDIFVLSLTYLLVITALFALVFYLFVTFTVQGAVILFHTFQSFFQMHILTTIGFVGSSLAYFLVGYGFSVLLAKLVLSYPKIIKKFYCFLNSIEEEEKKERKKSKFEKGLTQVSIALIVVSACLILVSSFTKHYGEVVTFIHDHFSYQTIVQKEE